MSRQRRRAAAVIGAVVASGAIWMASCTDLGPKDGVFSISTLRLPSPGIVLGDTMRDSLGVAAPLRVIGFTSDGDTVAGATPTFITLDTNAHLVGGTVLVGDHLGSARVVGGIGSIQTRPESVKVTLSPDTIIAGDSTHHLKTYSFITGDTLVTSADLTTRVQHLTAGVGSDVDAVIVTYSIVQAPAAKGTLPTITMVGTNQVPSSRDTTIGGKAGRAALLHVLQLTGLSTDSAILAATASYRGRSLGTVQFTVVFKNQ